MLHPFIKNVDGGFTARYLRNALSIWDHGAAHFARESAVSLRIGRRATPRISQYTLAFLFSHSIAEQRTLSIPRRIYHVLVTTGRRDACVSTCGWVLSMTLSYPPDPALSKRSRAWTRPAWLHVSVENLIQGWCEVDPACCRQENSYSALDQLLMGTAVKKRSSSVSASPRRMMPGCCEHTSRGLKRFCH